MEDTKKEPANVFSEKELYNWVILSINENEDILIDNYDNTQILREIFLYKIENIESDEREEFFERFNNPKKIKNLYQKLIEIKKELKARIANITDIDILILCRPNIAPERVQLEITIEIYSRVLIHNIDGIYLINSGELYISYPFAIEFNKETKEEIKHLITKRVSIGFKGFPKDITESYYV